MDDERGGGASSLRKATSKIRETLPIRLTSFIGPEAERTAVRRLLDTDRLVTLTGAGGCGKTRFALQVATDRRNRHPDGVWWVDLSTLADHALVVDAIASELELKEVPGKLLDTLKDGLRGEGLLLLDNCEHLVEACAAIADDLLRWCPRLSILATSRERPWGSRVRSHGEFRRSACLRSSTISPDASRRSCSSTGRRARSPALT